MIKNDYIMTSSERIQDTLNSTTNSNEKQRKAIQLSKQLDEVVAGKHKVNKLSNPIRSLAQRYVDSITKKQFIVSSEESCSTILLRCICQQNSVVHESRQKGTSYKY